MTPPKRPEEEARGRIDADLEAAGWKVQDRDEINLTAGRGIAIREFSRRSLSAPISSPSLHRPRGLGERVVRKSTSV
jgi:hypothetical protein